MQDYYCALAEALYREALEAQRTILGAQHSSTLSSVWNLGRLLEDQGKLREAEALLREALTGGVRALGRAHADAQGACLALVRVLTAQGKARDAREVQAQYGAH